MAGPTLGWVENGDEGEINYHFAHPNPTPCDANLWHYEGEWILDLTYCDGPYHPGIEVKHDRHFEKGDALARSSAMAWAEGFIKPVIRPVNE